MRIKVINGPNINMIGTREPSIYGAQSLADINASLVELGKEHGIELEFYQSNSEGDLVGEIQRAKETAEGIIINAAAYTHTSVAILDAVLCCGVPVIEVHLSNPHAREPFRRVSYLAKGCKGSVAGFGADSYALALLWFARQKGA